MWMDCQAISFEGNYLNLLIFFFNINFLTYSRTYFSKKLLSIQPFLGEQYLRGKCLIPLKHRDFADIPIGNSNLLQFALVAVRLVNLTLLCFLPTHFKCSNFVFWLQKWAILHYVSKSSWLHFKVINVTVGFKEMSGKAWLHV